MSDQDEWQETTRQKKFSKTHIHKKQVSAMAQQDMMDGYLNSIRIERPKSVDKQEKKKQDQQKQFGTSTTISVANNNDDAPEKDELVKKIPFEKRQRLIQLRERKGLTRKEAAKIVQQAHSIIESYENGKGVYDPNIYNKIIQQLNRLPTKSKEKD